MKTLCTVIIPHYNQLGPLDRCLTALDLQSVDHGSFELFIVDNGTIGIEDYIHESRDRHKVQITWIKNDECKNPYVSRNIGVNRAASKVIAFLDASCIPHPNWIEEGYKSIEKGMDLVAGHFQLSYPSEKLKDKVHGLLYLNNQKNVERSYGVPCGNLFVKSALFDWIGPFGEDHISGQDIVWTRRALSLGYKISYSPLCIVEYPAFSYEELLRKMKKYGKGVRFHQDQLDRNVAKDLLRGLLPMRLSNFSLAITYRGIGPLRTIEQIYLWLLVWRAKVVYTLA